MEPDIYTHSPHLPKNEVNVIYSFALYHPYRGGNNPRFDETSSMILKLKNSDIDAINFFLPWLYHYFNNKEYEIYLTDVPSHDPKSNVSGIRNLIKVTCNRLSHLHDLTGVIKRTSLIPKLAYGGDRNIEVHENSIDIVSPNYFNNRIVIIVDDVVTSGNSLVAAYKLILKKSSPSLVAMLALTKTANDPRTDVEFEL